MSNTSTVESYYSGAAADFRGNEGKIVIRGATVGGKAVVALASAASVQALGVVVSVGVGSVAQQVGVCVGGRANVKLGDGWVPGTTSPMFKSDASGLAVPASAGDAVVGRLLLTEGVTALASGDYALAFIDPSNPES